MYNEFWARISFVLVFVGFNVTFFPQFILGFMGMPRRYHDYAPVYQPLNQLSTIGSWMIGLGFVLVFYVLVQALLKGKKAPENPWGAVTLEWKTSSPPPHENFHKAPSVTGKNPYQYPSSEEEA